MQLKNSKVLKMQSTNLIIDNPDYNDNFTSYLQGCFVYASIWGFGGVLDSNSRPVFDNYFKELWKGEIPNLQPPKALSSLEIILPKDGTLYDYTYNCVSRGHWKHLSEIVNSNKLEEKNNIDQTLVHTFDTAK